MTPSKLDRFDSFQAADRTAWRDWLAQHHASSPGIWLVFYKKNSNQTSVTYEEAVEEALCFGWIDSLMRPIDEYSYKQAFTPRKPGSGWSRVNKLRVEKMINADRMTPAGLEKVEAARQDGSWTRLDDVEDLRPPADLAAALAADPAAQAKYESLPASRKKQVLGWMLAARKPETRQARIAQALANLARNCHPVTGEPI